MARLSRLRSMFGMGKESDPDPVASTAVGGSGASELAMDDTSGDEVTYTEFSTVEGDEVTYTEFSTVEGDEVGHKVAPVEGDEVANKAAPVESDEVANKAAPVDGDEVANKAAPVDGDEVANKAAPELEDADDLGIGVGELNEAVEGSEGKDFFVADSFSFGVEREMKESGEKGGTDDMDINIGVGELQDAQDQLAYEPVEGPALEGGDLTTVEAAVVPAQVPDLGQLEADPALVPDQGEVEEAQSGPAVEPADVQGAEQSIDRADELVAKDFPQDAVYPDLEITTDGTDVQVGGGEEAHDPDVEAFFAPGHDASAEPTTMVPLEEASPEELRSAAAEIDESADLELELDDLGGGGGDDLLDQ